MLRAHWLLWVRCRRGCKGFIWHRESLLTSELTANSYVLGDFLNLRNPSCTWTSGRLGNVDPGCWSPDRTERWLALLRRPGSARPPALPQVTPREVALTHVPQLPSCPGLVTPRNQVKAQSAPQKMGKAGKCPPVLGPARSLSPWRTKRLARVQPHHSSALPKAWKDHLEKPRRVTFIVAHWENLEMFNWGSS